MGLPQSHSPLSFSQDDDLGQVYLLSAYLMGICSTVYLPREVSRKYETTFSRKLKPSLCPVPYSWLHYPSLNVSD